MKIDDEYKKAKEAILADYKCAFNRNKSTIIYHGAKKIPIEMMINELENDLPEGIEEIQMQIKTDRLLFKLNENT